MNDDLVILNLAQYRNILAKKAKELDRISKMQGSEAYYKFSQGRASGCYLALSLLESCVSKIEQNPST